MVAAEWLGGWLERQRFWAHEMYTPDGGRHRELCRIPASGHPLTGHICQRTMGRHIAYHLLAELAAQSLYSNLRVRCGLVK